MKRVRPKQSLLSDNDNRPNGSNGHDFASDVREDDIRAHTALTHEGRDRLGRFEKGWRGGPGNPHVRRLAALKKAVAAAVDPWELHELFRTLLQQALNGDVAASRVLLDRCLGRVPLDINMQVLGDEEPNPDDRFL